MRKLFYKGELITSEDAHELSAEDRVWITGRKAFLEKKFSDKKEKKKGGKK